MGADQAAGWGGASVPRPSLPRWRWSDRSASLPGGTFWGEAGGSRACWRGPPTSFSKRQRELQPPSCSTTPSSWAISERGSRGGGFFAPGRRGIWDSCSCSEMGWHDLVLLMARTASARHPTLQDCRQRTCLRQPRVAQNWPSRCLTSRTARMAHSCQVGLGVGKPSQLPAACTRKSLCLSRGSLIVTEKKA